MYVCRICIYMWYHNNVFQEVFLTLGNASGSHLPPCWVWSIPAVGESRVSFAHYELMARILWKILWSQWKGIVIVNLVKKNKLCSLWKTSSVFPAMAASHRDTDILLKTDLAYSVVQSYRSVQKKKKISHVSRKKTFYCVQRCSSTVQLGNWCVARGPAEQLNSVICSKGTSSTFTCISNALSSPNHLYLNSA